MGSNKKKGKTGSYFAPLYIGEFAGNEKMPDTEDETELKKWRDARIASGECEIVYCFNGGLDYPYNSKPGDNNPESGYDCGFSKIEDATQADMKYWSAQKSDNAKDNVLSVIYNGYPYDKAGAMEAFGLSEIEFRAVTQAAVWWYTDGENMNNSKNNMGFNQTRPDGNSYLKWDKNLTNAYNFLIGKASDISLVTPPDNFELNLYINEYNAKTDNYLEDYSAVQNLLGTKLTKLAEPAEEPSGQTPSLELTAQKTLNGGTLAAEQFSFLLKDATGTTMQTKKNAADGTITFDAINYTTTDFGKTFKYTVSEVNDGTDGVTYDDTVYTVGVTINAQGDLTYTISKPGEGTVKTVVDKITFSNTIETQEADQNASVTISKKEVGGTQELEGASLKITVGDKSGATATDAETGETLSWTSTGTAKKVNLVPGTYTMVETAAPTGYEVATEITFTVNDDKTITVGQTTTTSEAENVVTMFDGLENDENPGTNPEDGKPGNENDGKSGSVQGQDDKNAHTGDNTNVMIYILLLELAVAVGLMEALAIQKKKRNNNC